MATTRDPLARIRARDEARKAEKERRAAEIGPPNGLAAEFASRFGALCNTAKTALSGHSGSGSGTNAIDEPALKCATEAIAEMRQELARAALALSAHDLRAAQETIDALQSQLSAAADAARPKKRFTFTTSRKPSPVSASSPSPAAAPTVAAATEPPSGWHCDGFHDRSGATLVRPRPAAVATAGEDIQQRGDFALTRLRDCDVFVFESFTAVHVADLERCRVLLAPTRGGSVCVDRCRGCIFAIASQQLRIHTTTHSRFSVLTKSGPIIEHSTALVFSPYTVVYPELESDLVRCGFADSGSSSDTWRKVQDFNWIKPEPSPNWVADESVQQIVFASTASEEVRPTTALPPLPEV